MTTANQANNQTARVRDENGYIKIARNPISRSGVFQYLGASISPACDQGRIYNVYRPAEELANPECIDSFKLIPIVDDHTFLGPSAEDLTPPEQKGVHGTTGEDVDFSDGVLYSTLKIFSEALADTIESGKKDLSLGYRCDYEQSSGAFAGQSYDFIQRNLRGNHLALVDEARCNVSVLDKKITFDHVDFGKETEMSKEKKKQAAIALKKALDEAAAAAAPAEGAAAPTVADLAKHLQGLTALIQSFMSAGGEAEGAGEEDEMEMDADGKPIPGKKKVPPAAADPAAAAAPTADKGAMDAKLKAQDKAIEDLKKQVEDHKKDSLTQVLKEVSQRDSLAKRLFSHIGVFDHSEKTLAQVAKYGVEKIGLKCQDGQELSALEGYLHARPVNSEGAVTNAMDAKAADSLDKAMDGLFNPAAK